MASISKYPFVRHLRAEPSRHVLYWRKGQLKKSARGLAIWFQPLSASIAELPCDNRELPFVFHARSEDYQDVTVQGVVTWRVADPELLAERLDFSLDLSSGKWLEKPLDQIAEMLTGQAQQFAWSYLVHQSVRVLLADGVEAIRDRISSGLKESSALPSMGIEVVEVVVSRITPTSELEKAMQTPALEAIQQAADEATFERRALAVEKERAIQENELQNQIELSSREAELILQRGQNDQRAAKEAAESKRIESEAAAARTRLDSETRADSIVKVEAARIDAERERMEIYKDLEPKVMLGLAAREFASKLQKVEHLNLTPDLLGSLFADFFQAGSRYLEQGQPSARK